MTRSDIVDVIFWGVMMSIIAALIGLFQCKNWMVFLNWVAFIGLFLDAAGALALVLTEFWPIQSFLWPGVIAAKNRIEEAKSGNDFGSHQAFLEQGDDGFEELAKITRDRRTISNPEIDYSRVEIEEFRFWPNGAIYADGVNVNQVTLASPEEVQVWISDRITTVTRNKVYPYAALILFIGFTFQLISYGLRNL